MFNNHKTFIDFFFIFSIIILLVTLTLIIPEKTKAYIKSPSCWICSTDGCRSEEMGWSSCTSNWVNHQYIECHVSGKCN